MVDRRAGLSTGRLSPLWLVCSVALATPFGSADGAGVPSSGELLQEAPPPVVPPPAIKPGLTIEQPATGPPAASSPFFVRSIEISGNTLIPTSELRPLLDPSEGKNLTLTDLEALASAITKYYQDHGYLLSRAYVPAQTLSNAVVRIDVLEARYGTVSLTNTSQVSDARLKSILSPLQSGDPVSEGTLQRSLLLLSDVPGTVVNSTLSAGPTVGSSNLLVLDAPGAPEAGSVSLDDAGNRSTGRARLSATVNVNNPLHLGDTLSLSGMTTGGDLNYARLGYQTLVDGEGTTVGAALSGLEYRLGHGLSELKAHGTAEVESLTLLRPIIRSTEGNLFAQLSLDSKQLRDELGASNIHTDRETNALTTTLAGDERDAYGISNMNLGLSLGHLNFDNQEAQSADALGARTRGSYDKFAFSFARLQGLNDFNSLYFAFNGQLANRSLDSSEQYFLGGPNSVRAYDVGAVGGALGALATLEFRHNLDVPVAGTWQAKVFVESGVVKVDKYVFATGPNTATLSGAGIGLNWTGPAGWTANADLATPIGTVPALVGHTSSLRLWIELHKAFSADPGSL
jgi:hemolysin activation/secretion protein